MTNTAEIDVDEIQRNADLVAKIVENSIGHIKRCLEMRQRQANSPQDVAKLNDQLQGELIEHTVSNFSKKTNGSGLSQEAERFNGLTETTQKAFAKSAIVAIIGQVNAENKASNIVRFGL